MLACSKGQLKLIDNTIDEQSGTISLRAVMDNEKKTTVARPVCFMHTRWLSF